MSKLMDWVRAVRSQGLDEDEALAASDAVKIAAAYLRGVAAGRAEMREEAAQIADWNCITMSGSEIATAIRNAAKEA